MTKQPRLSIRSLASPTVAALTLAVASATTLVSPAYAQELRDNYKCYRISEKPFFNARADLLSGEPEFDLDPTCRVVGRGRMYCVPVASDLVQVDFREGPTIPDFVSGQDLSDHRICYKIKCSGPGQVPPREIHDAFGRRLIERFKAQMLCTSASAEPATSTTTTTEAAVTTTTLTTTTTLFVPPSDPALLSIGDVEYRGAFRLPASTYGVSSLNFSEGPLEYNPANHSIFIVGHDHQQAIAEFAIPALVMSSTLSDLNMAGAPLQAFVSVLGRAPHTDEDNIINQIGGLALVDGGSGPELIVNAYEYYDAAADNWLSTLVLRDPVDLEGSAVAGFYEFQGEAGHTSGWISPVPSAWQGGLGGAYITGQSSGIPIISRTSVGPSAFAFDPSDLLGAGAAASAPETPTTKLLDYSLANPLAEDLSNSSGTNNLWTHLSRATYGFVVPGTRTYLAVGYSGGHGSGVGYKITQDNGNLCGGYCAYEAADYDTYYWAYDLDDLLDVKAGTTAAHAVRPYESGVFPVPFPTTQIGGGTFDPASGLLYLTLQGADREQGTYSNPPVVAAFGFDLD